MFDVQSFENLNYLKLDGFEKPKKKKIAKSANILELIDRISTDLFSLSKIFVT